LILLFLKKYFDFTFLKVFYKSYRYGFLGTRYKKLNRLKHLKSINYDNWYNNLYSDHVPIFCDIHINRTTIRLLFSNNLSINSSRGINNNTSKFVIKDIQKLEDLSKNQIADFFIKEIKLLLKDKSKFNKIWNTDDNCINYKKII
tara:strand:+ start:1194 stop:1628 length:435 start_codon:yes stop_codon:yes gene_type:complete